MWGFFVSLIWIFYSIFLSWKEESSSRFSVEQEEYFGSPGVFSLPIGHAPQTAPEKRGWADAFCFHIQAAIWQRFARRKPM